MLAGGCARRSATNVERLAMMPLDNLSSDSQWNWYSRASSAVIQYDLAGAKDIFAKTVDSLPAAQSMQASRVLEGYFFDRNGRIGIRATAGRPSKDQDRGTYRHRRACCGWLFAFGERAGAPFELRGATFRHQQRERLPVLWRGAGSGRRGGHRASAQIGHGRGSWVCSDLYRPSPATGGNRRSGPGAAGDSSRRAGDAVGFD